MIPDFSGNPECDADIAGGLGSGMTIHQGDCWYLKLEPGIRFSPLPEAWLMQLGGSERVGFSDFIYNGRENFKEVVDTIYEDINTR